MPANIVKPGEEHIWERAKKKAAEQGHAEDWPYIVSIFQKMRGGKSMQKSYVIPPAFRRGRIPGQIPTPEAIAHQAGLDKKPPDFDVALLMNQTGPMLTPDAIVKGLGLHPTLETNWQTFLRGVFMGAPNEIVLRKAILEKATEEGHHPALRRVLLQRSLSHWKERMQKSMVQIITPDDLIKAEARGGMYYKRMPSKNGKRHRYFYNKEDYDKRDDAHVSGDDATGTYLSNKVCKCVGAMGKKGCGPEAFDSLVKKYGTKRIAKTLKDTVKDGRLSYKKGKFYSKELKKGLPKEGVEGGRKSPPKDYPKSKKQYADPKNFKYPLDTEKHVRAAISYFSKPKNAAVYSSAEQKSVWGRIKSAAKKYGIKFSKESGPPSVEKSLFIIDLEKAQQLGLFDMPRLAGLPKRKKEKPKPKPTKKAVGPIAIGKRGGKIYAYDKKGNPIYSQAEAQKLAAKKQTKKKIIVIDKTTQKIKEKKVENIEPKKEEPIADPVRTAKFQATSREATRADSKYRIAKEKGATDAELSKLAGEVQALYSKAAGFTDVKMLKENMQRTAEHFGAYKNRHDRQIKMEERAKAKAEKEKEKKPEPKKEPVKEDKDKKAKLAEIFEITHKDYRGIFRGKKSILVDRGAQGSVMVPLDELTDEEIASRVRTPKPEEPKEEPEKAKPATVIFTVKHRDPERAAGHLSWLRKREVKYAAKGGGYFEKEKDNVWAVRDDRGEKTGEFLTNKEVVSRMNMDHHIKFKKTDNFEVTPESKARVAKVKELLKDNPYVRVETNGFNVNFYTDLTNWEKAKAEITNAKRTVYAAWERGEFPGAVVTHDKHNGRFTWGTYSAGGFVGSQYKSGHASAYVFAPAISSDPKPPMVEPVPAPPKPETKKEAKDKAEELKEEVKKEVKAVADGAYSAQDVIDGNGPYKVGDFLSADHDSEKTAYVIDDYPYGRLRTEMRVWVETSKHGQRTARQTLNPKTGRWNKPKRGTYSDMEVMYMDEKGHVQTDGVSIAWSQARLKDFVNKHPESFAKLPESQQIRIHSAIAYKEAKDKGMSTQEALIEGKKKLVMMHVKAGTFVKEKAEKEAKKKAKKEKAEKGPTGPAPEVTLKMLKLGVVAPYQMAGILPENIRNNLAVDWATGKRLQHAYKELSKAALAVNRPKLATQYKHMARLVNKVGGGYMSEKHEADAQKILAQLKKHVDKHGSGSKADGTKKPKMVIKGK